MKNTQVDLNNHFIGGEFMDKEKKAILAATKKEVIKIREALRQAGYYAKAIYLEPRVRGKDGATLNVDISAEPWDEKKANEKKDV